MGDLELDIGQEWPALPCLSREAVSVAGSATSREFEKLGSEDSFSFADDDSDATSEGWQHVEDSDGQSDITDFDSWSSYLKKALAAPSAPSAKVVISTRKRSCRKLIKHTKHLVMMPALEEEDGFEKPMSDIKVARREGKFHGLDGHTARKGCGCRSCYEQLAVPPVLERNKECKIQGNSFGYLSDEIEKDDFGAPMSRLEEPFSMTAFELSGGDTAYSLGRGNAWEELPAILAEHSVAAPRQRTLANGSIQTSYLLEPLGELLPSSVVATAQHELAYHIHQIQRHKPRLLLKLSPDAPEGVNDPLLKSTLRCRAGKVVQEAVVRCNNCAHAWDVAAARGYPLDIDLGATCDVSHFSTQGRHPVTRRYPHVSQCQDTRQWHVEDEEYNNFNVRAGQRYKGPWWTVKCDRSDSYTSRWNVYHKRWLDPQWVGKYELWSRGDQQGSPWTCVGVFAGNVDATTEVAHAFRGLKGGLRARYLRVVPLETEGGGALRVGVYGRVVQPAGAKKTVSRGGSAKGVGGEEESEMVTYTLTVGQVAGVGRENRNTRYARDRNAPCKTGGVCRYDYGYGCRKELPREQARREARAFWWEEDEADQEPEGEADDDSQDGEAGDGRRQKLMTLLHAAARWL